MHRVAFDTSVIVAGVFASHAHYPRARIWLEEAKAKRIVGLLCLHGVAEVFRVLTSNPRAKLSPNDARLVIENVTAFLEIAPCVELVYMDALDRCSTKSLESGAIFDALHLSAARGTGADYLLTFNEKDFLRMLRPGDPKIVVPPDPPAIAF